MSSVVIVGGGVSGLFSAYYLSKLNFEVTVIDNASFQHGCSHGNAGLIVPSHIIPLAAPGILPQAIKWMFNSRSPFSFHPRMDTKFISWCIKFLQNSTKSNVNRSIKPLRDISFLSKDLYSDISTEFDDTIHLQSKGLLMLYKSSQTEDEEMKLSELANKQGIETNILTNSTLNDLDPNCQYNVKGAVHYLNDMHLSPNILMKKLLEFLKAHSVRFVNDTIANIDLRNNKISSISGKFNNFKDDEYLFTSGVWTSSLMNQINLNLPLVPGKGYSFTQQSKSNFPTIPSILVDDRVAVTPIGDTLRIAGTMEIDKINSNISMNRVEGMVDSFNKYYPELNVKTPKMKDVWYGLRPCSPDGLPFIGKCKEIRNLSIAAGHAMLGLSLGPATGKLISEIISESNTSIAVEAFRVNRYS